MGFAASAEGLEGPARRYVQWARQMGQNIPNIENLVKNLCTGFFQHPGAFLHDESFQSLDRNIEVWSNFY